MSTSYSGADLFAEALEQYGVEYLFGNPGTTELPVTTALEDTDIEYVLGLHEDIAVGMAAGYASTRRYHAHRDSDVLPVGVVNLHVTPGLAHGLGNLYNAAWAGAPLVVTTGNHSRDHRHEEPILSGDLLQLVEKITKWNAEVTDIDVLPMLLRRAFQTALTPPTGPVFLSLPVDVMMEATDAKPERLGPLPTAGRGDAQAIDRAADLLAEADEPVAILGDQVARCDAVDAAVELAEAAGLRVHAEILSTEVTFPSTHTQWASIVPPDEESAARIMDTDTIVFVGCSSHTTITRHEKPLVPPETTCVHVGPDTHELGKNHPADATVLGDPGQIMSGIAARVRELVPEAERESRLQNVVQTREHLTGGREADGTEIRNSRPATAEVVSALSESAPDAFVVDGTVTAKYPLFDNWTFEPAGMIGRKGGGLGYGICAVVGAAIAMNDRTEDRPVVGYISEGSYFYYPHAMYTAARYGIDLTVIIPDNRSYEVLKRNTLGLLGGEREEYPFTAMDFDDVPDIPANVASHGATGRLIEADMDLSSHIAAALDEPGPTVLDIPVRD